MKTKLICYWKLIALSLIAMSLLAGCATPVEIKNASTSNLQALDAVNDAVGTLQTALEKWHSDQQALIKEDGGISIAMLAVMNAAEKMKDRASAQQLFDTAKQYVQPIIRYALQAAEIDKAIERQAKLIDSEKNPLIKGKLQNDLDDLKLKRSMIAGASPPSVIEIAEIVNQDLSLDKATLESDRNNLQILSSQLSLLRVMAKTVDDWLSIDIGLTQKQVDGLRSALDDASKGAKK